jgi:hypothetical protein
MFFARRMNLWGMLPPAPPEESFSFVDAKDAAQQVAPPPPPTTPPEFCAKEPLPPKSEQPLPPAPPPTPEFCAKEPLSPKSEQPQAQATAEELPPQAEVPQTAFSTPWDGLLRAVQQQGAPGLSLPASPLSLPGLLYQVSVCDSMELPDFEETPKSLRESQQQAAMQGSQQVATQGSLLAELEVIDRVTAYATAGGTLMGLNDLLQQLKHELGLSWRALNAACRLTGLCLSDSSVRGPRLRPYLRSDPDRRVPRALLSRQELRLVRRAFLVRVEWK